MGDGSNQFFQRSTHPQFAQLRILMCREAGCSVAFAAPMAFIAARLRDNQPIHCPAGHVYCDTFKTDHGETLAINIALTEANAELLEKLNAAERELIELRAQSHAVELTEKEIDRRRHLLAAKARTGPVNRKVCQFCGRLHRQLAQHLLNQHREEIMRLSPQDFL